MVTLLETMLKITLLDINKLSLEILNVYDYIPSRKLVFSYEYLVTRMCVGGLPVGFVSTHICVVR